MTTDEVEELLKKKIAVGEADPGLFDAGLMYVIVEDDFIKPGGLTFKWFQSMRTIDDLVN